jgi:hypothetical protein
VELHVEYPCLVIPDDLSAQECVVNNVLKSHALPQVHVDGSANCISKRCYEGSELNVSETCPAAGLPNLQTCGLASLQVSSTANYQVAS